MATEYTFKNHKISTAERLWLEEAARPGFFPRRALTNLGGKMPDEFRPDSLDARLYLGARIKPIGLWYANSQNAALGVLDKVIRAIKARIPPEDVEVTFTAVDIASAIGEDATVISLAFQHLTDFGAGFFDHAYGTVSGEGFDRIQFNRGNLFDYYRKYQGMEDLLERALDRIA